MKNIKKNVKTEFKPNYAVSPIEIIADYCLYQTFGRKMVADFEKGITEKNVYFLTAMFPSVPKKFWFNLQKQYDQTVARLKKND